MNDIIAYIIYTFTPTNKKLMLLNKEIYEKIRTTDRTEFFYNLYAKKLFEIFPTVKLSDSRDINWCKRYIQISTDECKKTLIKSSMSKEYVTYESDIIYRELKYLPIKYLTIETPNINNYSLKYLRELQLISLKINSPALSNVEDISQIKTLRMLTIENNQITNISALLNLPYLNILEIGKNNISYFTPVKLFRSLLYYDIRNYKKSNRSKLYAEIYINITTELATTFDSSKENFQTFISEKPKFDVSMDKWSPDDFILNYHLHTKEIRDIEVVDKNLTGNCITLYKKLLNERKQFIKPEEYEIFANKTIFKYEWELTNEVNDESLIKPYNNDNYHPFSVQKKVYEEPKLLKCEIKPIMNKEFLKSVEERKKEIEVEKISNFDEKIKGEMKEYVKNNYNIVSDVDPFADENASYCNFSDDINDMVVKKEEITNKNVDELFEPLSLDKCLEINKKLISDRDNFNAVYTEPFDFSNCNISCSLDKKLIYDGVVKHKKSKLEREDVFCKKIFTKEEFKKEISAENINFGININDLFDDNIVDYETGIIYSEIEE